MVNVESGEFGVDEHVGPRSRGGELDPMVRSWFRVGYGCTCRCKCATTRNLQIFNAPFFHHHLHHSMFIDTQVQPIYPKY